MFEEFGEYLKPQDVAIFLEVSVTTVYKLLRKGKLPGVRLGEKLWRIPKQELIRYMLKEDLVQVW